MTETEKRKLPVHIPLAFDGAVRGPLAVDREQLPKSRPDEEGCAEEIAKA